MNIFLLSFLFILPVFACPDLEGTYICHDPRSFGKVDKLIIENRDGGILVDVFQYGTLEDGYFEDYHFYKVSSKTDEPLPGLIIFEETSCSDTTLDHVLNFTYPDAPWQNTSLNTSYKKDSENDITYTQDGYEVVCSKN